MQVTITFTDMPDGSVSVSDDLKCSDDMTGAETLAQTVLNDIRYQEALCADLAKGSKAEIWPNSYAASNTDEFRRG